MNRTRSVAASASALLLVGFMGVAGFTGCASYQPVSQTSVGGETAYIRVMNAPKEATVIVDGIQLGLASELTTAASRGPRRNREGPKVISKGPLLFPVRPGPHRIQVMLGDDSLIDRKVFAGSAGITTLEVPRR